MDYRVTIAIPESDDAAVEAIFDALLEVAPASGPVMGQTVPDGPTDYVMTFEADDVLLASTTAVDSFQSAVAKSRVARTADAAIIDLHVERVRDSELQGSAEFQTA
jgi:hypothetical protein